MTTRERMEEVIKKGRSVYGPDGRLYTKVEDLPSEATLAKGDKDREEEARKSIKAELARLANELASLEPSKASEVEASVSTGVVPVSQKMNTDTPEAAEAQKKQVAYEEMVAKSEEKATKKESKSEHKAEHKAEHRADQPAEAPKVEEKK